MTCFRNRKKKKIIRSILILAFLVLAAVFLLPGAKRGTAVSEGSEKVVRVGWYESTFNHTDVSGHLSGYGYEYQMKIAAYTGWRYEYVHGSWPELMDKLARGEIDMLSDVSYLPEREANMLYGSYPMGAEEYYLFVSVRNKEISPADLSTLTGKRIGVNEGSIQAKFFREWVSEKNLEVEIIEVSTTERESLQMLETGQLDGYVTVDSFVRGDQAVPICKIGASEFYFAVTKGRPDLLAELDAAMSRIQEENRYYNQQMMDRFFMRKGANAFLGAAETEWLQNHGKIRVGYQENYLAFCATDPSSGKLTGILEDYLDYASRCIANVRLEFEPVPFPSTQAAFDALSRGDVDCVFPANIDTYEGEKRGLLLTRPLANTNVLAIVRKADLDFFSGREHVIVAVNKDNPNYDSFLSISFPGWKAIYYPSTEECLLAVEKGMADCVLISNYRYNSISRFCEKHNLTALDTGMDVDYCFAVRQGGTELYSIMSKVTTLVPDTQVNAAILSYVTEGEKPSVMDYVSDHPLAVILVSGAIALVILVLLFQSLKAQKKSKRLIEATETDDLTGLYNRDYFFQYANRLYQENTGAPMDAVVINIDRFHSVNALNGRAFGDQVLQTLGTEIRAVAEEKRGIAGRFQADRFDLYCQHTEDYTEMLHRLQDKLELLSPNTSIRLRMGVMHGQEHLEPVQLFDRARTACSLARDRAQEQLVVYDEKVGERENYEQRLLNDLRRALDSYEFEVYYQPQYDIQAEPPKLVGAEALIRWNHPELGLITPNDFIPLFERNGKIWEVDQYVWNEAVRQVARWHETFGVTIPVSVNLSRMDVFDPALEKTLDRILAYNGLDHDTLRLEVTETSYTENREQVIRVVDALRRNGYEVEMDDFGTGYSSLNMLSAMPTDVLKMDRDFVRDIGENEKNAHLVGLIIGIAKSLRIPVVAEGVETEYQLKILREMGCELVQGYYFSQPLPAAEFEEKIIRKALEEDTIRRRRRQAGRGGGN